MFVVLLLLLKIISCTVGILHEDLSAQQDFNMIMQNIEAIKEDWDWNKILQNIQAIKEDCGEVCDLFERIKVTQGQSVFDQVKKHIKCDRLFSSKHIDSQDDDIIFAKAPRRRDIPDDIMDLFTYNRRVSVHDTYFNQAFFSRTKKNQKTKSWNSELLQHFKELHNKGEYMKHGYGPKVEIDISKLMDDKMLDQVKLYSLFQSRFLQPFEIFKTAGGPHLTFASKCIYIV